MCEIQLIGGLPFVRAELDYRGRHLHLDKVLVDTGSGGSVFSADRLFELDLRFERGDPVHRIRGVGGAEFVFSKQVDAISLGSLRIGDFEIEVGALEYGLELEGILGMDFLRRIGADLDLDTLRLSGRRQGHGRPSTAASALAGESPGPDAPSSG